MLIAHIGGMPFEELMNPLAGVMAASAVTFLPSAFARRCKRRTAASWNSSKRNLGDDGFEPPALPV